MMKLKKFLFGAAMAAAAISSAPALGASSVLCNGNTYTWPDQFSGYNYLTTWPAFQNDCITDMVVKASSASSSATAAASSASSAFTSATNAASSATSAASSASSAASSWSSFQASLGGHALTLGANFTTTGAGAITLANGSSAASYTLSGTTGTLAQLNVAQTWTAGQAFPIVNVVVGAAAATVYKDTSQAANQTTWQLYGSIGTNFSIYAANDGQTASTIAYQISRGSTYNVAGHHFYTSVTPGSPVEQMTILPSFVGLGFPADQGGGQELQVNGGVYASSGISVGTVINTTGGFVTATGVSPIASTTGLYYSGGIGGVITYGATAATYSVVNIYQQHSDGSGTRTATILDASGNTSLPGGLTTGSDISAAGGAINIGSNIYGAGTAAAYTIGANPSASVTTGGFVQVYGSTAAGANTVILGAQGAPVVKAIGLASGSNYLTVTNSNGGAVSLATNGGNLAISPATGITTLTVASGGATDVGNLQVSRTFSAGGGTVGFVNSALAVTDTVSGAPNSYEWGINAILNSSASTGQHVALAGSAAATGVAEVWGGYFQSYMKSGASGGNAVGVEIQGGRASGVTGVMVGLDITQPATYTMDEALRTPSGVNVSLFANGGSYGGGTGVLYLGEDTVDPSSNPTGGAIFFVDSTNHVKVRGASGTVTTLANP